MEQQSTLKLKAFEEVRAWSEREQYEDKDVFKLGYVSIVHERIKIGYCQSDWQDLRIIWTNWDNTEIKLFTKRYRDIALLLQLI